MKKNIQKTEIIAQKKLFEFEKNMEKNTIAVKFQNSQLLEKIKFQDL